MWTHEPKRFGVLGSCAPSAGKEKRCLSQHRPSFLAYFSMRTRCGKRRGEGQDGNGDAGREEEKAKMVMGILLMAIRHSNNRWWPKVRKEK